MDEDPEKKIENNFKNNGNKDKNFKDLMSAKEKAQIKKHRWQRECREREKLYPVYIDMNNSIDGKYVVTEKICEFCTNTVYMDPHHVNKNHKGVPHDRYVEENDSDTDVKHHFTHCRGFWGTDEDKEKCRKLREMKAMPDPFYKTNPNKLLADLKKKQEKGTLRPEEAEIMKTMEKKDEDKKLVQPDKIATLDDVMKEEELEKEEESELDKKIPDEITTVPNRFKHTIEIEADTYRIAEAVIDQLITYYRLDQLKIITQENKR